MIAFHLKIVPPKATSQTAGRRMAIINGKPMFFKNKKAAEAEHDLLVLCAPHAPTAPLEGPIALQVDFVWDFRKSETKKQVARGRIPHTSKPDCSNIIKQIEDCMTKLGFWRDDGQIADLHVTKAWGEPKEVGIRVAVHEIEPANVANVRPAPSPRVKNFAQPELL